MTCSPGHATSSCSPPEEKPEMTPLRLVAPTAKPVTALPGQSIVFVRPLKPEFPAASISNNVPSSLARRIEASRLPSLIQPPPMETETR